MGPPSSSLSFLASRESSRGEDAIRIRLPARTSLTLNANTFAYKLSRNFEFETLWRRIAVRPRNLSPWTPPIFICPFCDRPYVRMNSVTEQSAGTQEIPFVHIILYCEAHHWVRVECSQYPDHLQISSEARTPALSAPRVQKRTLSRDT